VTPDDLLPVSGGSYTDQRFVNVRLTGELHGATFRDCVFEECDLRELRLHACEFVDSDLLMCDLGLLDVAGSRFRGVTLEACHVVGVEWSRAFTDTQWRVEVDAKECVLNFCSYAGLDLRRRRFEGCTIHEALFDGCDLRDASFRHSDLSGTQVEGCDLRGADLRTARNYAIAAGRNRVEGLRASLPEAAGLLTGLGIDLD
jgi:fluoroquinolone resistance protein